MAERRSYVDSSDERHRSVAVDQVMGIAGVMNRLYFCADPPWSIVARVQEPTSVGSCRFHQVRGLNKVVPSFEVSDVGSCEFARSRSTILARKSPSSWYGDFP